MPSPQNPAHPEARASAPPLLPPARRRRRGVVRAATPVAAAALVLAAAGAAAAHVTVSSPDAAPGSFGKLVFRVPSESASAATTAVEVTLPAGTPFAFVSTKPLPGWKVTTTQRKLTKPMESEGFTLTKATATVTWTAQPGQGLRPGEFDEFELSVGPFPEKASTLALPAVQTYSDGTKVAWDQPTPASGKEPEHPAPTLDLTRAGSGSTPSASASSSGAGSTPDGDDAPARWLGGGGLVLGAAALAVAAVPRRRRAA